jgi:hypothetical protein
MKRIFQGKVVGIILAAALVLVVMNAIREISTDSKARDRTINFMAAMNPQANTVQICEERSKAFDLVTGSVTVILPTSGNNALHCTGSQCCLEMRRIQGDQDVSTFDGIKDAQTNQRAVSFFTTRTGYAIVFGRRDAGQ